MSERTWKSALAVRKGSQVYVEGGKDGMRDNGRHPRNIAQQANLRDLPAVTDVS
jgi:hypothetical protein